MNTISRMCSVTSTSTGARQADETRRHACICFMLVRVGDPFFVRTFRAREGISLKNNTAAVLVSSDDTFLPLKSRLNPEPTCTTIRGSRLENYIVRVIRCFFIITSTPYYIMVGPGCR